MFDTENIIEISDVLYTIIEHDGHLEFTIQGDVIVTFLYYVL